MKIILFLIAFFSFTSVFGYSYDDAKKEYDAGNLDNANNIIYPYMRTQEGLYDCKGS